MTTNHTAVIGPNHTPMRAVPPRWMRNSASRMPTVIGSTSGASCGAATSRPSTALSTEMAGVSTPSHSTSAAPSTAIFCSSGPSQAPPRCRDGRSSASSARMPPSPRLSARSTTI